ncbi:transposase [Bilophila wadsworthia]|jgi:transposase|uniref:transposase n=1 Tax=Bilophila wadsworthia TaxID=35833 RepID=UPI0009E04B90
MEVSHAYLVLLFRKPTGTYQALSVFRVDGRRVVNGIIYVIKHGLQWKEAPAEHGPHKTLYNRFFRWSKLSASTITSQGWRIRRLLMAL